MAKNEIFSPLLDEISENIIYLLALDSRTPISDLSRILGIPRRIVEHRVKNLYHKRYIKPLLIFNYPSLQKVTILLKLTHFDKNILQSLVELEKFVKVKETIGEYDISLFFIGDDFSELENVLKKIDVLYHNSIQKLDVIYHDIEDTLGMKSFSHNPDLLRRYTLMIPNKNYAITSEDKKILAVLKEKPILSLKDLAKQTNSSYSLIKDRISILKEQNIIRFSLDPAYHHLGLEFHNLLVKINPAKQHLFENNVIRHSRVHWLKKGAGSWDYILSITSRDINEFIESTREIRTQNKDIIINSTALLSKIYVERKL